MCDPFVVLELFPGASLFGCAFEAEGFMVMRGPDILYGLDVRNYRGRKHAVGGIIGGPPCQFASSARTWTFETAGDKKAVNADNLIPEFVRLVQEIEPIWWVMENVTGVKKYGLGPDDAFSLNCSYTQLCDWDCGGRTSRTRGFWIGGLPPIPTPPKRPYKEDGIRGEERPDWTVLASNWKNRSSLLDGGHQKLTPERAAYLQGFPGKEKIIMDSQPDNVSMTGRRCLAIHMLGNGVPMAMGRWIAKHVKESLLRGLGNNEI